jgi:hypothetical protein
MSIKAVNEQVTEEALNKRMAKMAGKLPQKEYEQILNSLRAKPSVL